MLNIRGRKFFNILGRTKSMLYIYLPQKCRIGYDVCIFIHFFVAELHTCMI